MGESYVKVKNHGYDQRIYGTQTDRLSGVVTDFGNNSYSNGTVVDSLYGEKNPFHKQQIKSAQNATTPCTGIRYKIEQNEYFTAVQEFMIFLSYNPSHVFTSLKTDISGYAAFQYPPYIDATSDVVTHVVNRCLSKFLDKASAVQSSFESGQDAGEYKESLHSLIRPMDSLKQYVLSYFPKVRNLKARYKKDRHSLKKALADTYLEWTFGWKPLVSDIADGFVGLQNLSEHPDIVPIEASASEVFNGSNNPFPYWVNGGLVANGNVKNEGRFTCRMKGGIKSGAVNGNISVAQSFQLLPKDFLPTAWDLLPYSFIADYFINIGEMIRGFSFCYSDLAWGVKTMRTSHSNTYGGGKIDDLAPVSDPLVLVQNKSFLGGSGKWTVTKFDRSSINPGDLIPRLEFSFPHSYKPWLNMAAIMLARSVPLVPLW